MLLNTENMTDQELQELYNNATEYTESNELSGKEISLINDLIKKGFSVRFDERNIYIKRPLQDGEDFIISMARNP